MIPATFDWTKDGVTYTVNGYYHPGEPQTRRDPAETSYFECEEIEPVRELSADDREDLNIRADDIHLSGRQNFFESLMNA